MKRIVLTGAAVCAVLVAGSGMAAAEGIPLTASDVDVTTGSAEGLGNAVGVGSVDIGGAGAILGGAFGSGYLNGVVSTLSAH